MLTLVMCTEGCGVAEKEDIGVVWVFKDDHIKEKGCELAPKNKRVERIWMTGGKGRENKEQHGQRFRLA